MDRFGSALDEGFGRLDGRLVAVVPPQDGGTCNADRGHVHLQLLVEGAAYDVAINVGYPDRPDVLLGRFERAPPGPAFSEGWHRGGELDYRTLEVSSSDFSAVSAGTALELEQELTSVDRISVWATGYGPDGAHLVHRTGGGTDGALVLDPLSASSRLLLFRFQDQRF